MVDLTLEEEAMKQASIEETTMEEATVFALEETTELSMGTSSGFEKTLNCPPGSSVFSSCTGTHCVVTCGNGKQVEMECPLEGVNTSTTNWPNGFSTTTATCGEKFDPPACFPFC